MAAPRPEKSGRGIRWFPFSTSVSSFAVMGQDSLGIPPGCPQETNRGQGRPGVAAWMASLHALISPAMCAAVGPPLWVMVWLASSKPAAGISFSQAARFAP